MRYEVRLASSSSGEKNCVLELERDASGWRVILDGRPVAVDAIEIATNTLSILLEGQSFEIGVTPAPDGKLNLQTGTQEFTAEVIDPRAWSGRRHGNVEAEGRQQIVAPMPGKIVRLLVKAGDHVEAGQGLLVVEAMKMQNEIRSPKGGTVERVLAKEGQPVNAGEVLCVVS
ncbi:MAG: acetyl-CoA carboxylase biotin carboxyl carrier protein subunit [Acidobacteria bacterium]|nr:MAG: acetyl-CoA carboxylase biotin carboxyl carrier protein subunit [Acidobacteriota bacterium]